MKMERDETIGSFFKNISQVKNLLGLTLTWDWVKGGLGLAHGLGTWFVVSHGIVPWYCMWLILYKAWGGSIVMVLGTVVYWMWVLYCTGCGHCIVLEERLWEHEEEVQRFFYRAYPFIFLDWNKRTGKFFFGRSPSFGWTTLYLCLSVLF